MSQQNLARTIDLLSSPEIESEVKIEEEEPVADESSLEIPASEPTEPIIHHQNEMDEMTR